jgi:hypothetical protein
LESLPETLPWEPSATGWTLPGGDVALELGAAGLLDLPGGRERDQEQRHGEDQPTISSQFRQRGGAWPCR